MKLSNTVFILFLIFTTCTIAQEEAVDSPMENSAIKGYEISIGGGLAHPYIPQDFKDQLKQGTDIHGGIGAILKTGDVGYSALYFTVGYNSFGANNEEILKSHGFNSTDWISGGGSVKMLNLHLNYKGTFSTERTIAPYFLIGVGLNNYKRNEIILLNVTTNNDTTFAEVSRSDFSWNLGVGFDVPFGETFALYVEGKYILSVATPLTQHFITAGGIRYRF
ncbi:MAG: outer membrane beta-barrel protein [Ignavibacteriae bacterium]|nr:outer membrane beta-barrel protein [Ignavibacteriota bacterium]